MGTTAGDRELEIDCPLAFGDAMSSMLARKGGAMRKFRYIQLSGAATERDQSKTLWFKGEMRNMKVIFSIPFSHPAPWCLVR